MIVALRMGASPPGGRPWTMDHFPPFPGDPRAPAPGPRGLPQRSRAAVGGRWGSGGLRRTYAGQLGPSVFSMLNNFLGHRRPVAAGLNAGWVRAQAGPPLHSLHPRSQFLCWIFADFRGHQPTRLITGMKGMKGMGFGASRGVQALIQPVMHSDGRRWAPALRMRPSSPPAQRARGASATRAQGSLSQASVGTPPVPGASSPVPGAWGRLSEAT